MSIKTKIIVVVIAILFVLFLVLDNKPKNKQFKIGGILPLTGDFGSLGEEINKGALIAIEELKNQGINLEYIPQDDGSTAAGSVNAANYLLNIERIDAVLTAIVQEAKPVIPNFNDAKVPLLVTWDSNNLIKTSGEYIFSIGFSTEIAGQKMAEFAYKDLKVRTVAVINHNDEWAELITSAFQTKFESLGGKIVMHEKTNPSETDYRTLLAKAKNLDPDGLWFPMIPPAKGPFMRQAKQLGLSSILLTGDGLLSEEIEDAGTAAENVYFANIFADDTDDLANKYKTKYNADPYDVVFASFGYDGIYILAEAYKISKTKNISLTEALKQVNIQGTGSKFNFNGTLYSEREEKIYQVINGSIQLIKP